VTVNRFVLDGTDFGVDSEKSFCSVEAGGDGTATIDLRVAGDQDVYNKLTADEESPWSWTLYPPELQIWQRADLAARGEFDHEYGEEQEDESEVSLYLMEHHFPLRLRVQVAVDGSSVKATGVVDFMGRAATVDILWNRR
jgi:hypothetical protein